MRGQGFPEDWTMPREFQIRHLIGLSLYVNGGFLNGHSFPPVFCLVTKGIRGIERLNIQILLIHAEDGPAEAHALVMSALHSGRSRFRGTNYIPTWRNQVHDVAERRNDVHGAVRIVGEYRPAGLC